jgi:DNA polymerase III beta subunit, C-terminal domain
VRSHICSVRAYLLHEALQRAVRVAPTKGAGFDKAGGLQFFIKDTELWIQACDLEHTFFQKVPATVETPMDFRIHTGIARFVGSLPMTGDQEVRFHIDSDTGRIEIQYMKSPTKIKVPTVVGEYPHIEWHDYDSMDDASELAGKLASVAWATEDSASGVLSGVHIDGEWIEALCSKQMAQIRCKVKTEQPIIAVVKTLTPLIAQGSRVRIKAMHGRVVVALDELAQVSSSTVMGAWPNLSERIAKIDLPYEFKVNRQRLVDALNRVLAFTNGDRFPRINLTVQNDRLVISLTEAKDGDITDSIALTARTDEEPVEFCFNPAWLAKAFETFPGAEVKVNYKTNILPLRLTEPMTSYNALIMGLQPGEKQASPDA